MLIFNDFQGLIVLYLTAPLFLLKITFLAIYNTISSTF